MVLSANFALTEFSEGCLAGVLGSSLEGYDTGTLVGIYRPHPWEYAAIVTW